MANVNAEEDDPPIEEIIAAANENGDDGGDDVQRLTAVQTFFDSLTTFEREYRYVYLLLFSSFTDEYTLIVLT